MRYFFNFTYKGVEHTLDVTSSQEVRSLDYNSAIVMNTFFPDIFINKTFFKLLRKTIEKGKVTYILTTDYATANEVEVRKPTNTDTN